MTTQQRSEQTATNRLNTLRSVLKEICEVAGLERPGTAQEAIDVLVCIESACRTAICEFYGHGEADALVFQPVGAPVMTEAEAVRVAEEREWHDGADLREYDHEIPLY